jgi:hypothetical protein
MKHIILFLFVICNFYLFSQEEKKIKIGVGMNFQTTFIEELIVDTPGLMVKNVSQPLGVTLTILNFKYQVQKKLFLESSLDIFSLQGIRYNYFGTSYTSTTALPQFNLGVSYGLIKKIFFYLGGTLTLNTYSKHFSSNSKTDFFPNNTVERESYGGFYFLPEIRLYHPVYFKKNNEFNFYISFTKGLKTMSIYNQKSYNPNSFSSFVYKGTKLKFGVNWYFKIKK